MVQKKKKKKKKLDSAVKAVKEEEDEVIVAFYMSESFGGKLQEILNKLEKLDTIEVAVKNIDSHLKNLEERTKKLEVFQTVAREDLDDLKKRNDFSEQLLKEKEESWKKKHENLEARLEEVAGVIL